MYIHIADLGVSANGRGGEVYNTKPLQRARAAQRNIRLQAASKAASKAARKPAE